MRWFVLTCGLACLVAGCARSPEAKAARALEKGKKEFEKKEYAVAVIHFKNAVAATPRAAEPYYQLGLSYLALNDANAAVVSLRRALELNPKHAGAQVRFSALLAGSGRKEDVENAEKRMRDLLAASPNDIEALNILAVAELRLGKAKEAEAHLLEALQKSPGHLQSSVALAQLMLSRKDVSGAEETLKRAVGQTATSLDARVQLGGFYVSQGKLSEAEQQYRQALAINAKHAPSLLALAELLRRGGRTQEAEDAYRRLSQLPDREFRTAYAAFLLRSGKADQGIAELVKLNSAHPDDRVVRTELIGAYLSKNRIADAEKVLTAVLKKNPRDVDALMQRAQVYLGAGKNVEAQGDLNQVLHYRSDSAEAHYLLAKVSAARENPTIQKQELGEALRLKPDYLLARIELADLLVKTGGAQSALQLLDDAPGDQKRTLPVVLQRNWVLLALQRYAEARQGIDAVLAAGNVPEAALQDAALRMAQKDYKGARTAAEKVLSQNPNDIRALTALVSVYSAEKQFPAALAKVKEHAAARPNSPEINHYLGQMLARSGDRAGARASFEAAVKVQPGFVPAELALAELDTVEGKRDEARKRLSALMTAHPSNVLARILMAQVELAEGKMTDAMKQYKQVVDIDPRNAGALNNVAYILADGSQPDEALKFAQQAKELAPENASIDDTLGWTYYKKGMYPLAVTHLEKAVSRESNARRQYHLAMAYLRAGDPKRGRQTLDVAVKMDPNLPEAKAARDMFKAQN